jgi:NAD+ synthase
MAKLQITLAQLNPTVGDFEGNFEKIKGSYSISCFSKDDLLVFPEGFLTGYPQEDLVLRPAFMQKVQQYLEKVKALTIGKETAIIIGTPWTRENGKVYNAAVLIEKGVTTFRFKHKLPNYACFDEKRIYTPAKLDEQSPIKFRGVKIGLMICEDMWHQNPAMFLRGQGAELFIAINGSPYEIEKHLIRKAVGKARVEECGIPLLYVNQVCGQDEIVFDGGSFFINETSFVQCAQFMEACFTFRWNSNNPHAEMKRPEFTTRPLSKAGEVYKALKLGLRDYVKKCNFPGVVIGLSGGIDSALTAAIAVDALGADKVKGILMPGPFSSEGSITDAEALAANLSIETHTIPITPLYNTWVNATSIVDHSKTSLTHENVQARFRGLMLMTYSNETGFMVLSTGNDSEVSVGYATLYGDMCGGYNVLKDVPKTLVFQLASYINELHGAERIPTSTITKPPSAELNEDQKDSDSLPPYEILDEILRLMVDEEKSVNEIVALGFNKDTVTKVQRMIYRNEFKRRQACPGVKITGKSYGKDRRYPIVNKYLDDLGEE